MNAPTDFSDALKKIPAKIVVQLIMYIIGQIGIAILTGISSFKITELLKFNFTQSVLIAVAVTLIVSAILFFLLKRKYKKFQPYFEITFPDFYILEKEYVHEYLEKERIRHIRRLKLKSMRDGLNSFNDKFCWTGESYTIKAIPRGHRVLEAGTKNLFHCYIYQFDRVLKKNDTILIETEWMLKGKHKYFFSNPIEEPTGLLKMKIRFPEEWGVDKVMCDISPLLGAKIPLEQIKRTLTRGEYVWEVKDPKLYHCYEISWEFIG